ncbi:LysR family transcriptional regulator [Serratia inhibens]|uniref:LysR family transcriptional regulator n=1 Tax=Serratia inhibens TaxID=2338073 RepID=UPI00321767FB
MIGTLTLDQLRVLVTIVDFGSFSAAGRQLRRAQSAISQAIATMENVQGVTLFDRHGHRPILTDAGYVLVEQARLVLASAARFEAIAANTRAGMEPQIAIAIDPLVPTAPFVESMKMLGCRFPELLVSFSTEGLGGALRRLRSDSASLAVCLLLPNVPDDVVAYPLMRVRMRAVVAPEHSLALFQRPVTLDELSAYVQLVLSDPVEPESQHYGIFSDRVWCFSDLSRRLDFLLAGFGWCRMPEHMVMALIEEGKLVEIEIEDDSAPREGLAIYAAYKRGYELGPAGRWLFNELQTRFPAFERGK